MYYTIYKITNKANGKIYVGSHKTRNLNDSYMGSGKYLKYAMDKYGADNFEKEILFVYDNPEEMYAKEAEIVNEDFLATVNTYNLRVGGSGGWNHIEKDHHTHSSEHMRMMARKLKEKERADPEAKAKRYKSISSCLRQINLGEMRRKEYELGTRVSRAGCTISAEHKRKISEANSKRQAGTGNSQYGTMWVTDGVSNKKIKKTDDVPDGWRKGRIIKETNSV
jgi:hypothetical protein